MFALSFIYIGHILFAKRFTITGGGVKVMVNLVHMNDGIKFIH